MALRLHPGYRAPVPGWARDRTFRSYADLCSTVLAQLPDGRYMAVSVGRRAYAGRELVKDGERIEIGELQRLLPDGRPVEHGFEEGLRLGPALGVWDGDALRRYPKGREPQRLGPASREMRGEYGLALATAHFSSFLNAIFRQPRDAGHQPP